MLWLESSRLRRRAAIAVGTVAAVSVAACSDETTAPDRFTTPTSASSNVGFVGTPILVTPPPVIDGVMSAGEWDGAAKSTFPVRVSGGPFDPPTTATVYVTHDQSYLYLAVSFDRQSQFQKYDWVEFDFDNDHDGAQERGDDAVGIRVYGTTASDYFWRDSIGFDADTLHGGANNTTGRFAVSGATNAVVEVRKQLNSTDDAHDFSINTANGSVTLGMRTVVMIDGGRPWPGAWFWSYEPGAKTFCQLTIGKATTSLSCP